jgi:ATP-dependent Lon protease
MITTVIIPEDNKKDLAEIPENITGSLDIHAVRWIDEVLDIALERPLQPLQAKDVDEKAKSGVDSSLEDESAETPVRPH